MRKKCSLSPLHIFTHNKDDESWAQYRLDGVKVSWFQNVFLVSSISQKTCKIFDFPLWYLNSNCFRSFFGRMNDTKMNFEIKWPLTVASKVQLVSKGNFGTFKSTKKPTKGMLLKKSYSDLSNKVELLWEDQRYTYRVLQTIQMKVILL